MAIGGYSLIKSDAILEIGKYVLKRMEHNLNGGTIILFDTHSFDIWLGNESVNDVLKLIDGKTALGAIYDSILPLYEGYCRNEVIESFNSVIEELLDKKFLVVMLDDNVANL